MSEEDRELLRLAARVAGIGGEYREGLGICPPHLSEFHKFYWNPLEDDGDALRLAVLLNLHVQIDFNEDPAAVYIYGGWMGEGIEESIEECRYKAVRLAIVRAAAEIGKATA